MTTELTVAEKASLTYALFRAGLALMEQNCIRKHGSSNHDAAAREYQAWLHRKDDPVPGDVAGPVRIRYRAQ